MATQQTQANRAALRRYCAAFADPDPAQQRAALGVFHATDAAINVVHPLNAMDGPEAYGAAFLAPLQAAFANLTRTDYIAIAGEFDGAQWVSNTGYWMGHFRAPFLGIRPTGAMTHLRFGEFHRMEDGRAVESYVYLDLPELMIASGQWPITDSPGRERGYVGYVAGPAAQDGLHWHGTDPGRSQDSARMVTDMLQKLATDDEAWRPYWHDHMVWNGPAAFGAFVGIEEFSGFQVPFENAFDGWSGGAANNGMTAHFTRFGDGDFVCSGGWPSLTGVQKGRFLGAAPTGKRVFMRVCDWWSRRGDKLYENWIFVDIPDVLLQLGRDIFEEIEA